MRHSPLLLISALGIALTVLVNSAWSERAIANDDAIVDRRNSWVVETVSASAREMLGDAASAAAFVAVRHPSPEEFQYFISRMGVQESALGVGYVSLPTESLADRAQPLTLYVSLVDQGPDLTEYDAASDPAWQDAFDRAEASGGPAFSRLTQLFGVPGNTGMIAAAPVSDSDGIIGFVVVIARLEEVVHSRFAEKLEELVVWHVTDVTDLTPSPPPIDPLERQTVVQVGERLWEVRTAPTEEARATLATHDTRATLVIGFALSLLLAGLVHLSLTSRRRGRETERLRELTREKDAFLATVSHELRTPLTVVLALAHILEEQVPNRGDDVWEHLQMLKTGAIELDALVEDLLVLERAEADALPSHPVGVAVSREVERVLSEQSDRAHVDVTIRGDAYAWVDALRLRQILRNLLSNALRHARSKVVIEIARTDLSVTISMIDDGAGVPAARVDSLFEGMASRDGDTAQSMGVGLRIARLLARSNAGELTYARIDDLSIFKLELPTAEDGETKVKQGQQLEPVDRRATVT